MAEQSKKPMSTGLPPANGSVAPIQKAGAGGSSAKKSAVASSVTMQIDRSVERNLEYLSRKDKLTTEEALAALKSSATREREEEERQRQVGVLAILGTAIALACVLIILAAVEKSHVERPQGKVIGPTGANGTGGVSASTTSGSTTNAMNNGSQSGAPIVLGRPTAVGYYPTATAVRPGYNYTYTVRPAPQPVNPVQLPPVQPRPVQQPSVTQPVSPTGSPITTTPGSSMPAATNTMPAAPNGTGQVQPGGVGQPGGVVQPGGAALPQGGTR